MAEHKYKISRIRIINEELEGGKKVKTRVLINRINQVLGTTVTSRTIQFDIKDMKEDPGLKYFAPIEYDHSAKAWYYTDSSYSINQYKLQAAEISAIQMHANLLNAYRSSQLFKDFSNGLDKILKAVNIHAAFRPKDTDRSKIVLAEVATPAAGISLIPVLIKAIESQNVIRFEYHKFNEDGPGKIRQLRPYVLKESKNRWYVLGQEIEDKKMTMKTFSLDRISDLEITPEKYLPQFFDFPAYFQHSLGISIEDKKPVEVVLRFDRLSAKYVKSLPLHHSQQILKEGDFGLEVSVLIRPTIEFFQLVLSFGASVEVLSPVPVRNELKVRLKKALENYK